MKTQEKRPKRHRIKSTPVRVPVNPTVAAKGIPGFHHKVEVDGSILAGMELDVNTDPARVDTGTGDQPGNGARFPTSPDEK